MFAFCNSVCVLMSTQFALGQAAGPDCCSCDMQEDITAAGKVVETTRDPMFRNPETHEYMG